MAIFCFNLYQLLRHPYLAFKYQHLSKFIDKLFCDFFLFLLNIDKSTLLDCYCSSGTYKFITASHVYKMGHRWGALKKEQDNIHLIRNNFPSLASYLSSFESTDHLVFISVKMKKYKEPSVSEAAQSGIEVLTRLRELATKRMTTITEFVHLNHGLFLSTLLYRSLDLDREVRKAFSLTWSVGPVHGDFHLGNLLIDDRNKAIIIDPDNFSSQGIQALDAFTFWIDYKVKQTKMAWQDVIRFSLKGDMCDMGVTLKDAFFEHCVKSVALLYTLNRLGYENKYYGFLSRSVQREYNLLHELVDSQKED